jgi:hypothetical protein
MRTARSQLATSRLLAALAPLFFVAHVVEENSGFVAWFNRVADPDISRSSFLSVNAFALLVTILVALAFAGSRNSLIGYVALAWFGFLFLANATLHVAGTFVHGYSPGTVTGVCLYLPYFVALFRHVTTTVAVAGSVLASLVGALPMVVHGWLVVFAGSRLF